jgi:hypothetical protein
MIAQTARRGPTNDCATLRPLVDAAHQRVAIGLTALYPSTITMPACAAVKRWRSPRLS